MILCDIARAFRSIFRTTMLIHPAEPTKSIKTIVSMIIYLKKSKTKIPKRLMMYYLYGPARDAPPTINEPRPLLTKKKQQKKRNLPFYHYYYSYEHHNVIITTE